MMKLHDDGDGIYPVIEWRVFYENKAYCSCHDLVEDLPNSGIQAVSWFLKKDESICCQIIRGITTEPSIYIVEDRELIGTMLPDEIYYSLEEEIAKACTARVGELRRIHG